MFDWLRNRDRPPPPAAENPGRGHTVLVTLKNARKTWQETDDLAVSLATSLNALGHKTVINRDWVKLESGLSLVPQVVHVEPTDDSGVKTSTTIQISHATLLPKGIFEYQISTSTDLRDSLAKGFKNWAEFDLPVFLDALRAEALTCMVAKMEPDRRIVFGPTAQMAEQPEAVPGQDDFCPCCLFTKSIEAFNDLVKDNAFYGVHLFAWRNADGHIEADCRVNGVDSPEGVAALARYARTWPDRGLEYRKQYVCIQTRAPSVVSIRREVGQHVTAPGGRTP
jgi:hypothetical protein